MGRNMIPKLGEWRYGKMYRFYSVDSMQKDPGIARPDDGRLIVYELHDAESPEPKVLGTAFADGFQEVMAAMWDAGYRKGIREGRAQKAREIKSALAE